MAGFASSGSLMVAYSAGSNAAGVRASKHSGQRKKYCHVELHFEQGFSSWRYVRRICVEGPVRKAFADISQNETRPLNVSPGLGS